MAKFSITVDGEEVSALLVAPGERLLDACDDAGAPIEFSCRNASCAVCRVEVVSGSESIVAATSDERDLLARVAAGERERLACQIVANASEAVVVLALVTRGAHPKSAG